MHHSCCQGSNTGSLHGSNRAGASAYSTGGAHVCGSGTWGTCSWTGTSGARFRAEGWIRVVTSAWLPGEPLNHKAVGKLQWHPGGAPYSGVFGGYGANILFQCCSSHAPRTIRTASGSCPQPWKERRRGLLQLQTAFAPPSCCQPVRQAPLGAHSTCCVLARPARCIPPLQMNAEHVKTLPADVRLSTHWQASKATFAFCCDAATQYRILFLSTAFISAVSWSRLCNHVCY